MAIRVASRETFTVIHSASINDNRLSMRARGVLVWLLDKPDGWRIDSAGIARHCSEGRDAIRTALRELETHGYLRREKAQNPDGTWTTESLLYERPPTPENPSTDDWKTDDWKTDDWKSGVGFSGANNKTITQHYESLTNSPPLAVDDTLTPEKPVEEPAGTTPTQALALIPSKVSPEDVSALCETLQQAVTRSHPTGRQPTITAAWIKAMGTLLNTGIAGCAGPPPTRSEIETMIEAIFTRLSTRNSGGFCWADQIRSPGALRRHWDACERELANKQVRGAATHADFDEIAAGAAQLREILG